MLVATMASAMLDKLSGLGIACLRKELELNDLTHEGVAEAAWLNQEKDEDHAKGKRNDSYSMRI